MPNDTVVDPSMCDEAARPPQRLECYNDRCKGTWRVGEWSEVPTITSHCTALPLSDRRAHAPSSRPMPCGLLLQCGAGCDSQGVKHRILQCVWFGTKKAAGNACREQPRPVVMKACKGPPCAQGQYTTRENSNAGFEPVVQCILLVSMLQVASAETSRSIAQQFEP